MAIRTDQYTNSLTVVDTVNANAPLNLIPQGTAAVNIPGTGQNLILQSNTWTVAWSPGNVTAATTVATTDPLGTTTAYQLTESTDASPANHSIGQGFTAQLFAGSTYTWSMYIKAANRSWVYVSNFDNARRGAWFDLSTGTIGTVETGVTALISNQGNGWYRCSITTTLPSGVTATYPYLTITTGNNVETYTGTGVVSLYVWRAQLEISATPSTYIATTSSIVWNVPTLSFLSAATSSIGLQSNGSLYVQPAGTGALQAQATTSTATGGNARGANAVDWQTLRSTNTMVANGLASVLTGGQNNTASSYTAFVGAGANNSATGPNSAIVAGNASYAPGQWSFIGSGNGNTAGGYYNFIGGGQANGGTAQAAVTTQSATMNGTTAVTLAASNASIKVGQYISGTSIAANTYVAAISGTSLTLSQAASGSSTSTLSFYTPHGVVVGGGNNTATGSYSFIGGGGDAGTAGNRNVASGDWSVVGGGRNNTASGIASFIGGGGTSGSGTFTNTASASGTVVCGGFLNTSSGTGSFIGGGFANSASGEYSSVIVGVRGTTRSITGFCAMPAHQNPIADSAGVSQAGLLILGKETTNATPTVLVSGGTTGSTTNQVIMPNNSAYFFTGEVVAGVTGGGNTKGWTIEGVIKRGANAASTALVGTPTVTSTYADAGASTWVIAVTADTTNGGLAVTFTGQLATTIRVVCQVRTTEMTF